MSDSDDNDQTPPAVPPTEAQMNMQIFEDRIAQYLAAMKPSLPVDPEVGGQQQLALWNIIRFVISKKGGEFVSLYGALLKVFEDNRKGALGPKYAYRFHDTMRISITERRNYSRLMNLFIATCDPRTRGLSLRQVNMDSTLSGITDNDTSQRIVGFYAV